MEYKEIIEYMEKNGVSFTDGINDEDIIKIEKKYDIIFPAELKKFYRTKLPISEGYYNWIDLSEQNVCDIKKAMSTPKKEIIEFSDEVEWCETWEDEPKDLKYRNECIKEKVLNAPTLIPIYNHRYIASGYYANGPIFSIVGTDLIYYGKNLLDYLQIESGIKKRGKIKYKEVEYIPFWSDMVEG